MHAWCTLITHKHGVCEEEGIQRRIEIRCEADAGLGWLIGANEEGEAIFLRSVRACSHKIYNI